MKRDDRKPPEPRETVRNQRGGRRPAPGKVTRMEGEIFTAELAIYEKCMFTYIRNQQREAGVHEDAAVSALDEWNEYLQTELE